MHLAVSPRLTSRRNSESRRDTLHALLGEQMGAKVMGADWAALTRTEQTGTAEGPKLLHVGPNREVRHATLVAVLFKDEQGENVGVIVQWNCHPEPLNSKNTEISAD